MQIKTSGMVVLSMLFLSFLGEASGQTQQEVENAMAFTKLYGYIKYFHPSDEAASIDWDRFAVYGMKRASACASTLQLQNTLSELFKPIAPTLQLSLIGEKINFDKNYKLATIMVNPRQALTATSIRSRCRAAIWFPLLA